MNIDMAWELYFLKINKGAIKMIFTFSSLQIIAVSFIAICTSTGSECSAAALQTTYVSSTGSDTADCSVNAPCATFATALTKVAPFGEILALDAGDYGAVTVDKSVTINGNNGIARPQGSSHFGIIIRAGVNDKVTLRGLSMVGSTVGTGILIDTVKDVSVVNCFISSFEYGINVENSKDVNTTIENTSFLSNNDALQIQNTGGSNRVSVIDSDFSRNNQGIVIFGGSNTTNNIEISNSTFRMQSKEAIASTPGAGPLVSITATSDLFLANGTGIDGSNANTVLSASRLIGNNIGAKHDSRSAGGIYSTADNLFYGNTQDGLSDITTVQRH